MNEHGASKGTAWTCFCFKLGRWQANLVPQSLMGHCETTTICHLLDAWGPSAAQIHNFRDETESSLDWTPGALHRNPKKKVRGAHQAAVPGSTCQRASPFNGGGDRVTPLRWRSLLACPKNEELKGSTTDQHADNQREHWAGVNMNGCLL